MDQNNFTSDFNYIIERVPDKFNSLMVICISIFVIGLVLSSFLIKSPDKIIAEIRISSTNPPVVIKAKTTGNIKLLLDSLPRQCSRNEYIAVIDNVGDPYDVRRLLDHLLSIDPLACKEEYKILENIFVGEIYPHYSAFVQAINAYNDLSASYNQFSYEIEATSQEILYNLDMIDFYNDILNEDKENLSIRKKEHETDSLLFINGAILEREMNNSKLNYIDIKKQIVSEHNKINETKYLIQQMEMKINNLKYQYEKEKQMAKEVLLKAYNNLVSQILAWENLYVFKAGVDGTVEFANLISDNMIISIGEPAFTVVPRNNEYSGVGVLPFMGAGKVEIGQRVNIKLASYPYAEYGTISGIVKNTSQSPTEEGYLVYIELPNGLISSSGHKLIFAETMYGTAEIITKDKKLIQKIFHHIYNLISSKNENK